MEKIWSEQGPHERFLRELMNSRVDELVNSPGWLKRMRYRNDEVLWWNKRAGYIFEERGLNLYLIAEAQRLLSSHRDHLQTGGTSQALPPVKTLHVLLVCFGSSTCAILSRRSCLRSPEQIRQPHR